MRPSRRMNTGNRRDTPARRWRPWLWPAASNPGDHAGGERPALGEEAEMAGLRIEPFRLDPQQLDAFGTAAT